MYRAGVLCIRPVDVYFCVPGSSPGPGRRLDRTRYSERTWRLHGAPGASRGDGGPATTSTQASGPLPRFLRNFYVTRSSGAWRVLRPVETTLSPGSEGPGSGGAERARMGTAGLEQGKQMLLETNGFSMCVHVCLVRGQPQALGDLGRT